MYKYLLTVVTREIAAQCAMSRIAKHSKWRIECFNIRLPLLALLYVDTVLSIF